MKELDGKTADRNGDALMREKHPFVPLLGPSHLLN